MDTRKKPSVRQTLNELAGIHADTRKQAIMATTAHGENTHAHGKTPLLSRSWKRWVAVGLGIPFAWAGLHFLQTHIPMGGRILENLLPPINIVTVTVLSVFAAVAITGNPGQERNLGHGWLPLVLLLLSTTIAVTGYGVTFSPLQDRAYASNAINRVAQIDRNQFPDTGLPASVKTMASTGEKRAKNRKALSEISRGVTNPGEVWAFASAMSHGSEQDWTQAKWAAKNGMLTPAHQARLMEMGRDNFLERAQNRTSEKTMGATPPTE